MNHGGYADSYLAGILSRVKTIAIVGASPNWNRPSYFAMKYLQDKGFRTIPVNPRAAGEAILGERCYGSLREIPDPVDMVQVFRKSEEAGPLADEAIAIGAKVLWLQLGVYNEAAAERAEAAGLQVIMNRCPKIEYMRLYGEIGRQGVNSNVITSKRRPVKAAKRLM
jgi:O-acetylhomoserine (thiol)-lyase